MQKTTRKSPGFKIRTGIRAGEEADMCMCQDAQGVPTIPCPCPVPGETPSLLAAIFNRV